MKKGLIAVLVVLFLAIIGYGYYVRFVKDVNSKEVFDNTISYVKNEMFTILDETKEKTNLEYDLKFNLDLKDDVANKSDYSFINDIMFKGKIATDFDKKEMSNSITILDSDKELINVNMYAQNKNIYLDLAKLYDKPIKMALDEEYDKIFDTYSTKNINDVKTIISQFETALKSALKEEYFKSEDATVSVDGKDVKAVKHSLLLDEKTFNTIKKDVLTSLNNDEFISALENISDEYNDETVNVKDSLNEEISYLEEEIKDSDDKEIEVKVYLYTDNRGNVLKAELLNFDDVKIFGITKVNDNKYNFAIADDGTKKDILNGDVTVNGKSITIDMKLDLDETGELNHSFVIKVTETMIDFTYSSNSFGSLNAKLNIKENKDALSIPSLTNAVDYTELTEDDLNKIIVNITNDENIKNFVEKLGGTVNSGLIGL